MGWWGRAKKKLKKMFGGGSGSSSTSGGTSPGALSCAATLMNALENVGVLRVGLQRTGGANGEVTVAYEIIPVSAVPNVDYVPVSGIMTWPHGNQNQVTVNIPIINNLGPDPGVRSFIVAISNPTGGATLGNPSTLVQLFDDDTGALSMAIFRPASLDYEVSEAAGTLKVKIVRLGSLHGAVGVHYQTANGTALDGTHYTNTNGDLSWNDQEGGAKDIDIPIINVPGAGGDKQFTLVLSAPTGDSDIDVGYTTVTITILDVDSVNNADPGEIRFVAAAFSASEGIGTMKIQVSRVGGSFGAVSVDYEAVDGTAVNGEEFDLEADSLSWANGEVGPQEIEITINNDTIPFGNKAFQVLLSGILGGAVLGLDTADVTILDDDAMVDFIPPHTYFYREVQVTDTERDIDAHSPCVTHRPFGLFNSGPIGPSKPTRSHHHANDLYKEGSSPNPRPRGGRIQVREG